MRRAFLKPLAFSLLVALCYGRAFAQRADFRPYGDLGFGVVDWGESSPCGCASVNPAVTFGLTLPGHLRIGLRLDRVRAERAGWWLGPEVSYGFLPHERLRLLAAWRGPLRRDERTDDLQVRDTEYGGYGSAFDLRYHPWAGRERLNGWWLGAGYRALTERTTVRVDDILSSRTKTTHTSWQLTIGYQL